MGFISKYHQLLACLGVVTYLLGFYLYYVKTGTASFLLLFVSIPLILAAIVGQNLARVGGKNGDQ